jgi:hypothetical protein
MFIKLVELQDGGMTIAESRERIAAAFGVTVTEVQKVERVGINNSWLDD